MFGYVRIYKPEMKMAEFDQYQGVYCSLCKELGKRYGAFARLTLSYDFTFLAVFRMARSDGCAGFRKGRCTFNPMKKRLCLCDNPHVAFAADAATLLMYYKLRDNVTDKSFLRGLPARMLLPFASSARKKAAARYPELNEYIAGCMREQAALEADGCSSIDAAAEPSAKMLAYLATMDAADERERQILERFGYCLGRWIYLMDAVDDLPEDLENGGYNPYALSRGIQRGDEESIRQTQQYALLTLNACLAECVAAYNLLTIRRFDGILRNILEWGMPAAQQEVTAGKTANKKTDVKAEKKEPT